MPSESLLLRSWEDFPGLLSLVQAAMPYPREIVLTVDREPDRDPVHPNWPYRPPAEREATVVITLRVTLPG